MQTTLLVPLAQAERKLQQISAVNPNPVYKDVLALVEDLQRKIVNEVRPSNNATQAAISTQAAPLSEEEAVDHSFSNRI